VIRRNLSASWWTWPLQIATAGAAVGAIVKLWQRRFRAARIYAALQVTLILWGWGYAQFPYLVVADFTIHNSAAPIVTLRLLWIALLAGTLLLLPSFYYLYRVFKTSETQSPSN
jgi:cytochrome d ubiquinol oxidase subunit II